MRFADMTTIALFLGATALFGGAAHQMQLATDEVRFGVLEAEERTFLPDAEAMKVGVMGYDLLASDLLWVRAVLTFADLHAAEAGADARWLAAMLSTVARLDPQWRTVYFYGGSMLRVVGDTEASDHVYALGAEAFPDDPHFLFSLGMNAYLYQKPPDLARASSYLQRAAALPKAPRWYLTAAAGFLDDHGQRRAALQYLDSQLEVTTDPETRESLTRKRGALLHDELAALLNEKLDELASQPGRAPPTLAELGPLPEDPLGGRWIQTPQLGVVSEVRYAETRRRASEAERNMLMDRTMMGAP